MSLWKIAWRSIQRRALASSLTAASMALGVMMVVVVLLIAGVVGNWFRGNANLGYDVIVGAKGGRMQLVFNSVYGGSGASPSQRGQEAPQAALPAYVAYHPRR